MTTSSYSGPYPLSYSITSANTSLIGSTPVGLSESSKPKTEDFFVKLNETLNNFVTKMQEVKEPPWLYDYQVSSEEAEASEEFFLDPEESPPQELDIGILADNDHDLIKKLLMKYTRCILSLKEYDFVVIHRPGAQHTNTDSLSRLIGASKNHKLCPQYLQEIPLDTPELFIHAISINPNLENRLHRSPQF
ncbi:17943_t:CDS:2 [Gigaspora rosea]|nr:17943_t:CDS:2 [Gigaspora rosea]